MKVSKPEEPTTASRAHAEKIAVIDSLNDRAWSARSRDPSEAIQICFEALRLAREENYGEGEAYARSTLGICHWIRAEYREALNEATAARTLFERGGNQMGLARTLNIVGLIHWRLGDHAHALEGFMAAHRIYRAVNHSAGMANQMGNIAAVRACTGDYDQAFDAYRESIRIMEEAGNLHGVGDGVHNLGELLLRTGKTEEARRHLRRAMDLKASIDDWSGFVGSAVSASQALVGMGALAEAEDCLQAAYDALARLGLEQAPADLRIARARVLAERGKEDCLPEAIDLVESAIADMPEEGDWDLSLHAELLLSDLFVRCGNVAKARRLLRDLVEKQRARVVEDTSRKVRLLQVAFEVEQKRAVAEEERRRRGELDDLTHELRRLLAEKDAIMGTVSHDLQNPLNAISGFADLLGDEPLTREQQEFVRDIRKAADEMSLILGDLLRINELDARAGAVDVAAVDVAPLLLEMERRYAARARAKGISLLVHADATAPHCLAEEHSLRRIVDNLLSNAIKYTPKGGRVELKTRVDGNSMAIDVTDSGPGIGEDEQSRLFKPFERGNARPTGGEESVGLGLHIARRMARAMGADILCQSALGKGSVFTLYLPKATEG